MAKAFTESAEDRYRRFLQADAALDEIRSVLQDAYRYVLPTKENFFGSEHSPESKMDDIFDGTGMVGVQNFSSNLQSFLMPPTQEWMKLSVGPGMLRKKNFTEDDKEEVDRLLDKKNKQIFGYLRRSNYLTAMHEALMDLSVGTGIILINEGDDMIPFSFTAVPIAQAVFQEGSYGRLDNFWRRFKMPVRDIQQHWPQAKLTSRLSSLLNSSPDEHVDLIEGCICYPENAYESRYCYYVQLESERTDLFYEFRSYSPFVGFRFSKLPGSCAGWGPVLTALPFIRILNTMSEFELRSNKFNAYPTYMAASTGVINPYTLILEPGSIIPVEPNFINNPPIQPVPTGGHPEFMQMNIQKYQEIVREILFADPLPEQTKDPRETATAVQIRNQNWLRKNLASITRMASEWAIPFYDRVIKILRKKGLVEDLKIQDGYIILDSEFGQVELDYKSPIYQIDDQTDFQKLQEYTNFVLQTMGPSGMMSLNIDELPMWIAQKLGLDLKLVKNKDDMMAAVQRAAQGAQQMGMMSQQAPGASSPSAAPNSPQQPTAPPAIPPVG